MVEDKLIIPEEFKNYLNQVADIESGATNNSSTNPNEEKSNDKPQINNNNGNNNTIKNDSQMVTNQTFNVNGWRNPTTNLYPMSSPITQPQSPSSVISQIMPASPQQLISGKQFIY